MGEFWVPKETMASSFFGPESPRPFSVISEGYLNQFVVPIFPEFERFSFGTSYEEKMYDLIHKYLDLGTSDRTCYIGDSKGSIAKDIGEHFRLLDPIMNVTPGHFNYLETESQKVLPIRVANVGAEEYFRQALHDKNKEQPIFDKVILKDAIRYFQNPRETYTNIMKCVSGYGKMLVMHRPSNLNTLPVFHDAKQRLEENEVPYMDIIQDLQSCRFDVQWAIECVPIVMPKRKWYSMLKEKFPPQMEILSDFEIAMGLRELSEGMMKYEGDVVEFVDRLLFITVSAAHAGNGLPRIQKYGSSPALSFKETKNLKFSMEVTPDIKAMIHKPKQDKCHVQNILW